MIDINDYIDKECFYVLLVDSGAGLYKFGRTGDIAKRMEQHRKTFGKIEISKIYDVETYSASKLLEQYIKNHVHQMNIHRYYDPETQTVSSTRIPDCKNQTEMCLTDNLDDLTLKISRYIINISVLKNSRNDDEMKLKLNIMLEKEKQETLKLLRDTYIWEFKNNSIKKDILELEIERNKSTITDKPLKLEIIHHIKEPLKKEIKLSKSETMCGMCHKKFSNRSSRKRHEKTCDGSHKFTDTTTCKFCSKTYCNKYVRTKHELKCHYLNATSTVADKS